MKVLTLVLSSDKPPYDALYRAQERTWASEEVPGCPVRYYFCGPLAEATGKLRDALHAVWHEDWDFVFRTNSSSYVDRRRLVEKAASLPREKCYSGLDGGGFASGSGFFLSRDCVEILRRELPDTSDATGGAGGLPPGPVEDEVVGRVLASRGIGVLPGAERFDYWFERFTMGFYGRTEADFVERVWSAYHVRCKSDTANRERDVVAMEEVRKMKNFLDARLLVD